jgi:ribosomal protein L7/L12
MNHDLSPEHLRAIQSALQRGSKIEAVKLYRDATGASLAESKDAVEAMPVDAIPIAGLPTILPTTGMTPEKMNAIVAAISRGQKIEAIKLYREATGLGLAESKDAVEAMETQDLDDPVSTPKKSGQLVPEGRTPLPQWDPFEEKKKGCLGMVLLLIGIIAMVLFVR